MTTITPMAKGMKVKFSRNVEGEGELNHNHAVGIPAYQRAYQKSLGNFFLFKPPRWKYDQNK